MIALETQYLIILIENYDITPFRRIYLPVTLPFQKPLHNFRICIIHLTPKTPKKDFLLCNFSIIHNIKFIALLIFCESTLKPPAHLSIYGVKYKQSYSTYKGSYFIYLLFLTNVVSIICLYKSSLVYSDCKIFAHSARFTLILPHFCL